MHLQIMRMALQLRAILFVPVVSVQGSEDRSVSSK